MLLANSTLAYPSRYSQASDTKPQSLRSCQSASTLAANSIVADETYLEQYALLPIIFNNVWIQVFEFLVSLLNRLRVIGLSAGKLSREETILGHLLRTVKEENQQWASDLSLFSFCISAECTLTCLSTAAAWSNLLGNPSNNILFLPLIHSFSTRLFNIDAISSTETSSPR